MFLFFPLILSGNLYPEQYLGLKIELKKLNSNSSIRSKISKKLSSCFTNSSNFGFNNTQTNLLIF